MKKLLLTSLLFLSALCRSYSQNPVLNPGFENWTAGNPDDWTTDNVTGFYVPITQSTDAHSGTYSARGEVINAAGSPYNPLLYSTNTNGFPMTQDFPTLEFWYKLNSDSGDIMEVLAVVYDAAQSPIGSGVAIIGGNALSYTHFATSISYSGSGAASCHLFFDIVDTSGGGNAHIGSYFILDDVAMTNNSAGVKENKISTTNFMAFPNPASAQVVLNYLLKSTSNIEITLMDLTGKKILTRKHDRMTAGNHEESIDLSGIAKGTYICLLQTNAGSKSTMIQVVK